MKIDKIFMDLTMKTISEKIKEQEIAYNYVKDPQVKRMIDDRITQLKVELDLYERLLLNDMDGE